jgi:hypothetical protein
MLPPWVFCAEPAQAKRGGASYLFTLANERLSVKNGGGGCCAIANVVNPNSVREVDGPLNLAFGRFRITTKNRPYLESGRKQFRELGIRQSIETLILEPMSS